MKLSFSLPVLAAVAASAAVDDSFLAIPGGEEPEAGGAEVDVHEEQRDLRGRKKRSKKNELAKGGFAARSGKGGKSKACVPTPEDALDPYDPRRGQQEAASNAFLDCEECIPGDREESICYEEEREGVCTERFGFFSYHCKINDKCYYPPLKKALFKETGAGKCIEHDGLERCWLIHVPRSFCESDGPARLVVDIHGRGGTAYGWRADLSWIRIAEEEGIIVVWPQGEPDLRDPSVYSSSTDTDFDPRPSFNSEGISTMNTNLNRFEEVVDRGCCDPAITLGTDDVGFLRKMVEEVTEEYGIDKSRIYWTGTSNGCALSQTMAVVANDIVAGVACTSHYLFMDSTEFIAKHQDQFEPTPILEIHGYNDFIVPFGDLFGGFHLFNSSSNENLYYSTTEWPGDITSIPRFRTGVFPHYRGSGVTALGNREKWASFNKCSDYKSSYLEGGGAFQCGVPTVPGTLGYFIETSRDCQGDVEVANLVVERGGHSPWGQFYPKNV
ncbi:hypothetical protein THAOC_08448 [Thalassiosira oceanica]|uniref:Phospholipase/carboxylesterase/thioesterase domain-containing protein n=1 Tax=Thalassiosira oceanica TaxID=159749 RepID=K0TA24_THAOC|nr:hypothetical protein THAOC_08448 [Thalassiosira oceanica]|eukprot:EJK70211.1 hypothetical protein THAOC_08448 [Thalassiosira oceanica]